jgi:hypothetical protein
VEDDEIWSVPTDGGEERRETRIPAMWSWAPAQAGIYFLEGGGNRGRISFFDFAARHVQKLAELEGRENFVGTISVSPDGRAIFYSKIDKPSEISCWCEGFR